MKRGDVIRDTITGFKGVLTARTEWLNGCVRLTIQPQELKDGKPIESHTFDVEQCELVETAKPKTVKPTGGERENISRGANVGGAR